MMENDKNLMECHQMTEVLILETNMNATDGVGCIFSKVKLLFEQKKKHVGSSLSPSSRQNTCALFLCFFQE